VRRSAAPPIFAQKGKRGEKQRKGRARSLTSNNRGGQKAMAMQGLESIDSSRLEVLILWMEFGKKKKNTRYCKRTRVGRKKDSQILYSGPFRHCQLQGDLVGEGKEHTVGRRSTKGGRQRVEEK